MKVYCLIILFFTCKICDAQNLVPNGDFEITGIVPCGFSPTDTDFNAAISGWNSPTIGSPDIHSTLIPVNCSNHQPNSLINSTGSQLPHSGNIFAGFYTYSLNHDREYLQVQLLSPMVPGFLYHVNLYISHADNYQFATNNLGVGFSINATYINTATALGYTPQILFTNVVSDTANWVLMNDTITPTQPYEYIIIGNFLDNLSTNVVLVNPNAQWNRAYYYIDDVCISTNSLSCNSTIGINEMKKDDELKLFPNPFTDKINISVKETELVELNLFDITSRKIFHQSFKYSASINTEQLAKGIYLYEMRFGSGLCKQGKLVKD